ncbi:hypothetical protein Pint_22549 [Pistacia integerrima]|uniref:Uncharacterized protein n=1 Tax=Pistacia integerrima TaxID=434235 RepID=A0ACC0YJU3_9ROSI|nr:hypothetical protein Pint_22549 [Pistacia integerrima]
MKICAAKENGEVYLLPYEKFKVEAIHKFSKKGLFRMSSIGVMYLIADDINGNGGSYVDSDGNVSGDLSGEEDVQGEGDDDVGDEDGVDSESILSDFEDDSDEGVEIVNDDNVNRMSRHMKRNEFKYGADEKIHFKVGQVFMSVDHFRKVTKGRGGVVLLSRYLMHLEEHIFLKHLIVTNPGLMIELRVIRENVPESPKFKRIFLSFVA